MTKENGLAKCHPAPLMERSKASGFHIYLIGIIVLGVVAAGAYQFFS
ncbi:MAG TPA: hypothetical protein VEU95_10560 [Micropepsaceae bacterium]|nr:hypothetical protein [Micropepsaceae bacterium]